MLWSLLKNDQKAKEKPIAFDLSKVLEIDTTVINFGAFLPGKLLGSTIIIKNVSDKTQLLKLWVNEQIS